MSLMVMANSDRAIFGRAALAVLAMQVTQHYIIAWVLQGRPVVQKETSWKVAVVASLPQQWWISRRWGGLWHLQRKTSHKSLLCIRFRETNCRGLLACRVFQEWMFVAETWQQLSTWTVPKAFAEHPVACMQGKEKRAPPKRWIEEMRERESGFSAGQVCNQQAWADWCPSAARLRGLPSCRPGRGWCRWGLAAQLGSPATAGDASGSVPVTCRWSWHKWEWRGYLVMSPSPSTAWVTG